MKWIFLILQPLLITILCSYGSATNIKDLVLESELGLTASQIELSRRYETGDGVPKDMAKALHWYEKLAERGNLDAQYKAGRILANGFGNVQKNPAAAVHWFYEAAKNGHTESQYLLGALHYRGTHVEKDDKQAVNWLKKAAQKNHAEATYLLGSIYYEVGDYRQKTRGLELIEKAAAMGTVDAKNKLNAIKFQKEKEQIIQEAQVQKEQKQKADEARLQQIEEEKEIRAREVQIQQEQNRRSVQDHLQQIQEAVERNKKEAELQRERRQEAEEARLQMEKDKERWRNLIIFLVTIALFIFALGYLITRNTKSNPNIAHTKIPDDSVSDLPASQDVKPSGEPLTSLNTSRLRDFYNKLLRCWDSCSKHLRWRDSYNKPLSDSFKLLIKFLLAGLILALFLFLLSSFREVLLKIFVSFCLICTILGMCFGEASYPNKRQRDKSHDATRNMLNYHRYKRRK